MNPKAIEPSPPSSFFERLLTVKFWFLVLGSALIAIHLTCLWKLDLGEALSASAVLWTAVCTLLWKRRDQLIFESDPFSIIIGMILIALALIKSQAIASVDPFIRIFPFIAALGLVLMTSGIKTLKQYWQELLILGSLVIHHGYLSQLYDISKIQAACASELLWLLGYDVSRQGVNIVFPTGSVEVNPGCSGYSSILQLVQLSIIFLMLFSTQKRFKPFVPVAAIVIGFSVNIIRVAIMAVLSLNDPIAFKYWHDGDGSLIFSMIAVSLFALLCYFLIQPDAVIQTPEIQPCEDHEP
jgi:cyanoexosortase A